MKFGDGMCQIPFRKCDTNGKIFNENSVDFIDISLLKFHGKINFVQCIFVQVVHTASKVKMNAIQVLYTIKY